jgi:hypothetical protein
MYVSKESTPSSIADLVTCYAASNCRSYTYSLMTECDTMRDAVYISCTESRMSDLDEDFVGTKLGRQIEGGLSDFAVDAAVDGVRDRRHFAFGSNGPYTWALRSS